MRNKCGECKYFIHGTEDLGECHRFPPVPCVDGPAYFPLVGQEYECCGEFRTRQVQYVKETINVG